MNSIHDPLGIVTPFTLKLKLALKELVTKTAPTATHEENSKRNLKKKNKGKVDYDEELSLEDSEIWWNLVHEALTFGSRLGR